MCRGPLVRGELRLWDTNTKLNDEASAYEGQQSRAEVRSLHGRVSPVSGSSLRLGQHVLREAEPAVTVAVVVLVELTCRVARRAIAVRVVLCGLLATRGRSLRTLAVPLFRRWSTAHGSISSPT